MYAHAKIKDLDQILLDEGNFNSRSNIFSYADINGETALGRLTFTVIGEIYKAEESPWPFLCSDLSQPALYIAAPSQEEELEKEFQAWDAASDEIHGE